MKKGKFRRLRRSRAEWVVDVRLKKEGRKKWEPVSGGVYHTQRQAREAAARIMECGYGLVAWSYVNVDDGRYYPDLFRTRQEAVNAINQSCKPFLFRPVKVIQHQAHESLKVNLAKGRKVQKPKRGRRRGRFSGMSFANPH